MATRTTRMRSSVSLGGKSRRHRVTQHNTGVQHGLGYGTTGVNQSVAAALELKPLRRGRLALSRDETRSHGGRGRESTLAAKNVPLRSPPTETVGKNTDTIVSQRMREEPQTNAAKGPLSPVSHLVRS